AHLRGVWTHVGGRRARPGRRRTRVWRRRVWHPPFGCGAVGGRRPGVASVAPPVGQALGQRDGTVPRRLDARWWANRPRRLGRAGWTLVWRSRPALSRAAPVLIRAVPVPVRTVGGNVVATVLVGPVLAGLRRRLAWCRRAGCVLGAAEIARFGAGAVPGIV
ncbi:MAG TPA: hypothetical protein VGP91_04125, partial [Actinoplanes sp.]|nr:hypothetical protein [Actinoplanes sp.]